MMAFKCKSLITLLSSSFSVYLVAVSILITWLFIIHTLFQPAILCTPHSANTEIPLTATTTSSFCFTCLLFWSYYKFDQGQQKEYEEITGAGQMPFLTDNQKCQSTRKDANKEINVSKFSTIEFN